MTATNSLHFDRGCDMHDKRLYQQTAIAKTLDGLNSIDQTALDQYRRDGFIAVENVLTANEVREAMAGLRRCILNPDEEMKIWFEAASKEKYDALSEEDRLLSVRKISGFARHEPSLKAINHHPGILSVIRKMLGDKEPFCFQDMALIKPPKLGREKPWHQDNSYFGYHEPVVGIWVALETATCENGCMRMIPCSHREGPKPHFQRRDWQLCDTDVLKTTDKITAVELKPGGVLFFDGMVHHGTPHNESLQSRWAVQHHYVQAGAVTDKEFLKVFGGDGTGHEC